MPTLTKRALDRTMEIIALKIAEKRGLERSIGQHRERLGEVRDQCKRMLDVARGIKKRIDQTELDSRKRERENAYLRAVLLELLDQKDEKGEALQNQLWGMTLHNKNMWTAVRSQKQETAQISREEKARQNALRRERSKLEAAQARTACVLQRMKTKTARNQATEREHSDAVKEKARLLKSLIMSEGNSPTSCCSSIRDPQFPNKVSKILRSSLILSPRGSKLKFNS